MRVTCRHGHYAFFPRDSSEIGAFSNLFAEELARVEDYYTFSFLKDAEKYSLEAKPYLGLPALVTFEGNPWDVMRENGFVYSVGLKLLVPKETITSTVGVSRVGYYSIVDRPLIQAGARNASGQQILSFDGEFTLSSRQLKLTEFSYE